MAGSDTNRVRMTVTREQALGETPANPRMRAHRFTGEALQFQPVFTNSEEIRDDRMESDPVKVNETNQGTINGELSYPVDGSPLSLFLESAFANLWTNTPQRDNDGTADSVITGVVAATGVVSVLDGAAFVAGHLVRLSGFGQAGNNGLFKVTTGSSTVPAVGAALLTDEPAPLGTARMKVVGFEAAAGDITAVADGLASTAFDFTTLGLAVGQWVKIGGTGAAYRFAVETLNGWARVVGVADHKLTLDNLPTGWAVNAGAGKTLRVFFGDRIKNGVAELSQTIERGWMGQADPTYIVQRGMAVGQIEVTFESEAIAKYVLTFTGMTGELPDDSLDDTPVPVTTNRVMAAAVNVGRLAENGVPIGGPNYVRSLGFTLNNNLRALPGIRTDEKVGPVDIGYGTASVTVSLQTYFGSKVLLQKLFNGVPTNINARIAKDNQAMIYGLPRLTFTEGSVSAGGKNQDTMLPLTATASKDPLTEAHILLDRFEYYQA